MKSKSTRVPGTGSGALLLLTLGALVIAGGAPATNGAVQEGASPFDGTWQPSGMHAQITLAVKGGSVMGTVTQPNFAPAPITAGSVNDKTIRFSVESPDGQRTVTFEGSLAGDTVTFKRSVAVHQGGSAGGNGIFGGSGPGAFTASRSNTILPGSVVGRVVDKVTGRPLGKVAVHLVNVSREAGPVQFGRPPAEAGAVGTTANQVTPFGGIAGTQARGATTVPGGRAPLAAAQTTQSADASTARDGTFEVTGLTPGEYELTVEIDHYIPRAYGQKVWDGVGRRIFLRPGERFDAGDFDLIKLGVISGTVFDQNGDPARKVPVSFYYRRRVSSSTRMDPLDTDIPCKTDESGRYRLEDLPPGDYYVSVLIPDPGGQAPLVSTGLTPDAMKEAMRRIYEETILSGANGNAMTPRGAAGARGNGGGPGPSRGAAAVGRQEGAIPSVAQGLYLPVFYPGVTDPSKAIAVSISPGGQANGINLTFQPTPSAQVLVDVGGVTGPQDGAGEIVRTQISLTPTGLRPGRSRAVSQGAREGGALFKNVAPGSYRVIAVRTENGQETTAAKDIYVDAGASLSEYLTLERGIDVSGQISLEEPLPASFDLSRIKVALRLAGSDRTGGVREIVAKVDPNGRFLLHDVAPGFGYDIGLQGTEQNGVHVYAIRATIGNTEALRGPMRLTPELNGVKLQLWFGFSLGRVDVVVFDQGKPVQGVPTLLAPRRRTLIGFYRYALTDNEGKVVFSDMQPGDYDLFAWEDVREDGWKDTSFLDQFAGLGKSIHIEAGGTTSEVTSMIKVPAAN